MNTGDTPLVGVTAGLVTWGLKENSLVLWWSRMPVGMEKPNWLSKQGFTNDIFYPLEADVP